jgi:HAE1 family hydrophobic/amphiphilic exporter-1
MLARFFIDRPVFANVIAVVTVIFGVVALLRLPVEPYPDIAPPTVLVSTSFPGASAAVVSDTVATQIEQQVNGVEGMLYMTSTCSSDGTYGLTVTFEIGTNLDQAQVLVQNRVALAEPQLPEEVRRQGVSVKKQSTSIVQVISLTSPQGTHDNLFLANYATLRLRDELSRVPGVGETTVVGAGAYSMRVWLDPEKLRARNLTAQDVVAALQEHNVQVAAGAIGQPPTHGATQFQYAVTTLGRLSEPAQFEEIIVKTGASGRSTFLRDVGRVELGARSYDQFSSQNGAEAAALLIYQLPGSNALEVARGVKAVMERLSRSFPPDVRYHIPFDTSQYVASATREVYVTLLEAGALVLIVILVFLQDWRAVLVPATTVPVTIIGAFAFMPALGFSVNLLTLFGLVLAIGIVVDDAIVIVENAAHHIDRGENPREGTIRAMNEVTGPVIGITLVLMAVFVPTVFLTGITGQLYRQFALTIAATALLSAINALTLKPAQCALYLRPAPPRRNWLARTFNAAYLALERRYAWCVEHLVRHPFLVALAFSGLVVLTAWWYWSLPTSFLPTEDQGYVIVSVQLPDSAAQPRTRQVVERLNAIVRETPGIDTWFVLGGFSLIDNAGASNAATCFIVFKNWDQRTDAALGQEALLGRLNGAFADIQEATIFVFAPPAIMGLGVGEGFQMQVEDREGVGLDELQQRVDDIVAAAAQRPELGPATSAFRSGVPQLHLDVDRVKVKKLDVRLDDVFAALQTYLGSVYVNDFNKFGRTFQVVVQADARFRQRVQDIQRLEVRNRQGQMVPLGSLVQVRETVGPQIISRYNLYPSASIFGAAAPGNSSGRALDVMEQVAAEQLPHTMGYDWTALAFQEKRVGGEALVVFGLAVLLVYLVLAAQYESWLLPIAVILVVPLGLLGVVAGMAVRGLDNNIYMQIGSVLIIALASKNAILIVEFARELRSRGKPIMEAAVEAARLRFRPILMTSIAFILGVLPLVYATGAGAAGRRALGTAVCGGMISGTVLAVFLVPVLFAIVQGLIEWRSAPQPQLPASDGVPRP